MIYFKGCPVKRCPGRELEGVAVAEHPEHTQISAVPEAVAV